MKISIIAVLVLAVAVIVVESKWRPGRSSSSSSSKQKKLDRCFNYCKANSNVRNELIKNICPDYCEVIDCSGHGSCYMGRCTCHDGFSGCDCEIQDPCFNVHCQNGGTCEEGDCTCTENFEGRLCETDLCECVDCNDRGTCVAGTCQCQDGFMGDFCQTEDRCNDVMCNNDGTCVDGVCNCTAEFVGERCDMECNTVKGPCSIRQFVGAVNFSAVSRSVNIANVSDCGDICNANSVCLGFEYDQMFSNCFLYDVDISSSLIHAAFDVTSGVCTACC